MDSERSPAIRLIACSTASFTIGSTTGPTAPWVLWGFHGGLCLDRTLHPPRSAATTNSNPSRLRSRTVIREAVFAVHTSPHVTSWHHLASPVQPSHRHYVTYKAGRDTGADGCERHWLGRRWTDRTDGGEQLKRRAMAKDVSELPGSNAEPRRTPGPNAVVVLLCRLSPDSVGRQRARRCDPTKTR